MLLDFWNMFVLLFLLAFFFIPLKHGGWYAHAFHVEGSPLNRLWWQLFDTPGGTGAMSDFHLVCLCLAALSGAAWGGGLQSDLDAVVQSHASYWNVSLTHVKAGVFPSPSVASSGDPRAS